MLFELYKGNISARDKNDLQEKWTFLLYFEGIYNARKARERFST